MSKTKRLSDNLLMRNDKNLIWLWRCFYIKLFTRMIKFKLLLLISGYLP